MPKTEAISKRYTHTHTETPIMAGSQLKQLKAALKENGLTGQTNVKHKKGSKKAPSDTRRDDRAEIISKIREQFNPFEVKVNRKKSVVDTSKMKGAQGKPGISKQIGEESRRIQYEAKKARKNKLGTVNDRRFGERDSTLTPEEKMLQRFTRERQAQSSKSGLYSLDDNEDEAFGDGMDEGLTHYGRSLSLQDDFVEDDINNSDDDFLKPKKRTIKDRDDAGETEEAAVPKKKTKAEVMQEVMAKSKFYKQQRQLLHTQNEEKIGDLDDEFQDVLAELGSIPKQQKQREFSKDPNAVSYEQSVRELNMERRAAPADRTKTEEELRLERASKMRELEEARLKRMHGEDFAEKGADDLDDDFWAQSGDEGEGFAVDEEPQLSLGEEEGSASDSEEDSGRPKKTKTVTITCPESHEEFLDILEEIEFKDTLTHTNKILQAYASRLQAGNKEKLGNFTIILFQHILYLSESNLIEAEAESFSEIQEGLILNVKKLAEKYNNELTEALRGKLEEIHERIQDTISGGDEFPMVSDLTFFALVGLIYSTSDHYHLVVTPASIIMGESLEQLKYESLNSLIGGAFVAETFLAYQRISKRYIPEVSFFLQRALLALSPSEVRDSAITVHSPEHKFPITKLSTKARELRVSDIDRELTDDHKASLLQKLLQILDLALDTWKEKTALLEIAAPFVAILHHYKESFPDFKQIDQLSLKFQRLLKFAKDERKPLTLQSHKKLAIATYAPKFEENYNPEKKSYDHDRQRQEINKMKAQLKNERKITLREIRKDSRFEARQQIKERKEAQDAYHSKMARILNTINTVEGAEKNEYEKEKKARKGKK